jgi:hypothetical protein
VTDDESCVDEQEAAKTHADTAATNATVAADGAGRRCISAS